LSLSRTDVQARIKLTKGAAQRLFRSFAWLGISEPVWHGTTFTTNSGRSRARWPRAAIGDIGRFMSPQQLIRYVGPIQRVRQSELGFA
jgi:hypothetical protein